MQMTRVVIPHLGVYEPICFREDHIYYTKCLGVLMFDLVSSSLCNIGCYRTQYA